jgi:putative ABC transport system permease protein
MKQLTLTGILRRSLLHRRARSLSALVALTVSAGVATALLTLYADLDNKLHKEFRSFGANVVVTGQNFPGDVEETAQKAAGPDAIVSPSAYAVATTDRGTPVVVVAVDFPTIQKLNPWWQVTSLPKYDNEEPILLGKRAAEFVGNEKAVTLNYGKTTYTLHGVGHLSTGGDEDSRIYLDWVEFCILMAQQPVHEGLVDCVKPTVIEIQVPGGAAKVEAAIDRLKTAFPQATVSPVRQLVEGESHIIDRTHSLMYAAVLLIALTVAVSVLATLSASVLERRRDFALMKALGGRQLHLTGLFLLEAVALALAGVLAGFAIGSAAALLISEANFHTATLPRVSVLPLVLLLNLLIAALAALLPARVLRNLQPASLLRGD